MNDSYGADETSRELAAGLREFLNEHSGLTHVRDVWSSGEFDHALWTELSALGLSGALLGEDHGGLGVRSEHIVSSLEVLGYSGASVPLSDTVAVVVPILDRYGSAAQRAVLPALVSGEAIATSTVMVGSDRALFASDASVVLFERGDDLFILGEGDFDSVDTASPDPMSRLGRVVPRDGALSDANRLAAGAAEDARSRSAWAAAAVLNGVSRRMLDLTVEHAKTREQFGRPIGSFQAVKHLVADAWVAIESSRPTVWYAASASDDNLPDVVTAASVAKAAASDAAHVTSDIALQVHGGIGFTWEHPLHFWMKRAKLLEHLYGSRAHHLQFLGAALRDDQSVSNTMFASV